MLIDLSILSSSDFITIDLNHSALNITRTLAYLYMSVNSQRRGTKRRREGMIVLTFA